MEATTIIEKQFEPLQRHDYLEKLCKVDKGSGHRERVNKQQGGDVELEKVKAYKRLSRPAAC
jgi:hypothetical protein